MMGDNGGEFYNLKEDSKRLDRPEMVRYPCLYLDKDKMREIFKGAKIGQEYTIMAKCVIDGGNLEVRGIKLVGEAEDKQPKKDKEDLMNEPADESGMDSGGESDGSTS